MGAGGDAVSRDASVTLTFADGDYVFRLAWRQLMQLQEACDAGPWFIMNQLHAAGLGLAPKEMRVQYIYEVIRLGLIGGGLDPVKALKLVREYVEARPPQENLMLAQGVLGAALYGAPDEEHLKKSEAADPEMTK